MSEAARHAFYTLEEYLLLEERSEIRHEYVDGQILAMAGGTPDHSRICANVTVALGTGLAGRRCAVFSSDARVLVKATGLDTYPDVSVVCGKIERDAVDKNAITNPILVVEVGSPSTQAYDRGRKLDHYRRIPSLREVVLVSHDGRRLEVHRRVEGDEWTVEAAEKGAIRLQSIDCELAVEDVFRDPLA